MRGFIAHTDRDWWNYFASRRSFREVNFWKPGGRGFGAIKPGEPFFFRLKAPVNRVAGFGLFARAAILPAWRAWEVFGEANGVAGVPEFYGKLSTLARRPVRRLDPVGCVAIIDCTFFDSDEWVELPASFSPQNMSGSAVDLATAESRGFWAACLDRAQSSSLTIEWVEEAIGRERHGRPQITAPRLGQGSFRIAVLETYGGACAVTGEHALPALEAAHIKPWSDGGEHAIPNGLALRRDIHGLFDAGYVSVRPDGRFLVSSRLRDDFANGQAYYALDGTQIRMPRQIDRRPLPEFLGWHAETIFRAG